MAQEQGSGEPLLLSRSPLVRSLLKPPLLKAKCPYLPVGFLLGFGPERRLVSALLVADVVAQSFQLGQVSGVVLGRFGRHRREILRVGQVQHLRFHRLRAGSRFVLLGVGHYLAPFRSSALSGASAAALEPRVRAGLVGSGGKAGS